MSQEALRALPSIDQFLQRESVQTLIANAGRDTAAVRFGLTRPSRVKLEATRTALRKGAVIWEKTKVSATKGVPLEEIGKKLGVLC